MVHRFVPDSVPDETAKKASLVHQEDQIADRRPHLRLLFGMLVMYEYHMTMKTRLV